MMDRIKGFDKMDRRGEETPIMSGEMKQLCLDRDKSGVS